MLLEKLSVNLQIWKPIFHGSAITVVKATFSITEASKILEEVDCILMPPVRPKGGQVFLYQAESVDKQGTGICHRFFQFNLV